MLQNVCIAVLNKTIADIFIQMCIIQITTVPVFALVPDRAYCKYHYKTTTSARAQTRLADDFRYSAAVEPATEMTVQSLACSSGGKLGTSEHGHGSTLRGIRSHRVHRQHVPCVHWSVTPSRPGCDGELGHPNSFNICNTQIPDTVPISSP